MAEIQELVDAYRKGDLSRRHFVRQVIMVAGGLTAALPHLRPLGFTDAEAAQVDPNDPTLESKTVQFSGKAGTVWAYQSRPKAAGSYPAIICIHDNRGMSAHIEDVVRRFAREGYVALAVDYLSRLGGTAKVPNASTGIRNFSALAPNQVFKEETESAVEYFKSLQEVRADRLGIMGFCMGGSLAFYLSTQLRGFKAINIFYGSTPQPLDLLRAIEAPVLAHYGGEDPRVTGRVPETEEAMKRFGKPYTYQIYPGAKHAFFSDDRPDSYHPRAAREAWERTIAFFSQHLKG